MTILLWQYDVMVKTRDRKNNCEDSPNLNLKFKVYNSYFFKNLSIVLGVSPAFF